MIASRNDHHSMLRAAVLTIGFLGASPAIEATETGINQHTPANSAEVVVDLAALKLAAESGDAAAQAGLGDIYDEGRGVLQDFAAAAKWRRLAAAQGQARAQNALGRHYAEGLGVKKDADQARHFLLAAAEQGEPQHQHDLALLFDEGPDEVHDPFQAALWYQRAAESGFVPSIANLGLLYLVGRGVDKDLERALTLLTAAAESGHARAQNNLGLMYTRGDGVPQNYPLAVKWYQKAAAQGLAEALTNLGVMYENGFGVRLDETEAKRLYRLGGQQSGNTMQNALAAIGFPFDSRLAPLEVTRESLAALQLGAADGDPVAQYRLAYMLTIGDIVQKDFTRAKRLYEEAAAKGLHSAMLNLGLLHMNGLGVPQDYVIGYLWISRSAASGATISVDIRDRLFSYLTADQINEAQRLVTPR